MQLPLQIPAWARNSLIASLANRAFMPPTGQRWRHQKRFSKRSEPITAPRVISSSRQLLSQAVFSRFHTASQSRIAAKPADRIGAAQASLSPRGQRAGCQPRAPAIRWLISPQTMKGQNEHHSRPTTGYVSRITGHHQAQNMFRAPLCARSWGPNQSQRFTSTNTQLTTPNNRPFQSSGDRITSRSWGFQRQRSKRARWERRPVQKTSSGRTTGRSSAHWRRARSITRVSSRMLPGKS